MVFIPSRHVALTIVPHVHTRLPTSVKVLIMMMTKVMRRNSDSILLYLSDFVRYFYHRTRCRGQAYQLCFVYVRRTLFMPKFRGTGKIQVQVSKNLTPLHCHSGVRFLCPNLYFDVSKCVRAGGHTKSRHQAASCGTSSSAMFDPLSYYSYELALIDKKITPCI